MNAYKKFLLDKLKKNKDYYDYFYALDDINGDSIPELFIGTAESYQRSYAEQYFLYTYLDGKVKTLYTLDEHYSVWAIEYDKAKNYFIVVYPPRPSSWYEIYKFDGKKLKEVVSTDDYSIYKKHIKKVVTPDFKNITEENIKNIK